MNKAIFAQETQSRIRRDYFDQWHQKGIITSYKLKQVSQDILSYHKALEMTPFVF